MAQKVIQKYFIDEDMTPMVKLFEHREQKLNINIYVTVTDFGIDLEYRQETGRMGFDYGQAPQQTLHRKTEFINAEAVRKLFGAKNYSEMLDYINERFHEETAYDDLQTISARIISFNVLSKFLLIYEDLEDFYNNTACFDKLCNECENC